MRIYADELITVGTSAITLTQAKIALAGSIRATQATVTVKDADVFFSFQTNPPTERMSHYAPCGSTFDINGFDNLWAVNFVTTSGTAQLYVSYGN